MLYHKLGALPEPELTHRFCGGTANPNIHVRIAGYTSAAGTTQYNQTLSERRARSVRNYLITEGGIAPNRMTTIGFGKTRPARYEATPSDTDSRAAKANMRVLFEIVVN